MSDAAEMKIINLPLEKIIPYVNNPRRNDEAVDAVASSIHEYGWKQPIVLDKDHVIIVGHTRYKAAQKLGLETAPCVIADDLSPAQVKAYRMADNKVGEMAMWDPALLKVEMAELEEMDYDLSLTGFSEDEIANIAADISEDDIDSFFAPSESSGEAAESEEPRRVQCPHCGEWFELEE